MKKNLLYFGLMLLQSFAFSQQELEPRTVIIEEAKCDYDQHEYPKLVIRISPKIEVENKTFDTFIRGMQLDLCPNMEKINSRLYIPVRLQITDYDYYYQFDKNNICNYYQGYLLYMLIPVPTNSSKNYLTVFTPLESKLISYDVSPYNCSSHGDY